MKKKFLASIFVVAVATVAGWNFSQSRSEAALSDVALANLEALAEDETPMHNCSHGGTECVRVAVGNEVHIFYKN
ncbi:MAG: NVEALA domain-containing protein [Prevotellaceae bacterium]|jgi:uncharacterized Rmd1/YagE family protein|nr:NVEALA domain-containing protein [Prevotellaceae bacterium]